MFNKMYDKIVKNIKESIILIVVPLISFLILNIPLPYYISTPGKLLNIENKVDIENKTEIIGSYNMTYVREYDATVLTMLISRFNKDWTVEKKNEVILDNETEKDSDKRSKILLEEVNQLAVITAYNLANKEYKINNSKVYAVYIDSKAKTNLVVGDLLKKVNGKEIKTLEDITDIVNSKDCGDIIEIETDNGKKEAEIINYENMKKIGILLSVVYDLKLEKKVTFNFKSNESGSSGGLMTTLYIYDSLKEEDLAKGKKISGTGTVDNKGVVGSISGVKFKLIGAVKDKADIFFVPEENYEEALILKKKRGYNIDIIKVRNVEEAINYLEKN